MYECFHCGHRSVVWLNDFMFEDYGEEGEGLIHECQCAHCGALITYRIPLDEQDEQEETMTNRKWLESLNDTQFAAWLCDELEVGEMYGMTVYTGVNTEKRKYNSSYKGILQWLNENHIDFYEESSERGV